MAACVATIPASTPTVDFIDNGDGTVTHNKTGLMWKQCSEGLSGAGCATGMAATYTWQGALQAATTLNAAGGFAGFTDWRVPNIKELNSIVETQCGNPAINAAVFPNTVSSWYFSATTNFNSVWAPHFGFGFEVPANPTSSYYIRLVRGGL